MLVSAAAIAAVGASFAATPPLGGAALPRVEGAGGVEGRPFANPFGMQLRRPPASAGGVREPVILGAAPTNEACLLARKNGTLEIYAITKPASTSVSVSRSSDGGLTWSAAEIAFPLPGEAYYAVQVLEAADGTLHAVAHVRGSGPGGYRGRLYEVYHTRRLAGAAEWTPARRVVPGYVGSIRGFIESRAHGRLLLAVGRAVPEREAAPKEGTDFGWNDTFVYSSDDHGVTWTQAPGHLSLPLAGANVTRHGAIEPVLLELRDGRIWMLVRDRGGRLWQSFSADGRAWPTLERSPFISSDSPASLLRLRDGGILLLANACQNWSDPRSYAMGGREVLQAAVSRDEGRTWRGFREILHETVTPAGRGDRGTAYATAAQNAAGKVVVVSGQGEGKRAIVAFDPRWLEEVEVRDDLSAGPTGWTQYGGHGLRAEVLGEGRRAVGLPLSSAGLSGASWNFPSAAAGELTLRCTLPARLSPLRICLTDHFNRVDDTGAAEHAVFNLPLARQSLLSKPGAHDIALRWTGVAGDGQVQLRIDGAPAGTFPAQRPAQFGVNYLRLEARGGAEGEQWLISDVSMRVAR
jgi:hypothetical protein